MTRLQTYLKQESDCCKKIEKRIIELVLKHGGFIDTRQKDNTPVINVIVYDDCEGIYRESAIVGIKVIDGVLCILPDFDGSEWEDMTTEEMLEHPSWVTVNVMNCWTNATLTSIADSIESFI